MIEKRSRVLTHLDKGYIWSSDEALLLRYGGRIIGVSIGAISEFRSQNLVSGLPLQLSMEEVTLILRKGFARTVNYIPYVDSRNVDKSILISHEKHQLSPSNLKKLIKEKAKITSDIFSYEDYGEDNLILFENEDTYIKQNRLLENSLPVSTTVSFPAKLNTTPCSKKIYYSKRQIQIPLVHSHLVNVLYDVTWPFPYNASQRSRCAIFEEFNLLGYVVTDGAKFGGDFLAYPGYPEFYHAQFVIRVTNAENKILPCTLVANIRSSHVARKHLVLGSFNEKFIRPSKSPRLESNKSIYRSPIFAPTLRLEPFFKRKEQVLTGNHLVSVSYITATPDQGFGKS